MKIRSLNSNFLKYKKVFYKAKTKSNFLIIRGMEVERIELDEF